MAEEAVKNTSPAEEEPAAETTETPEENAADQAETPENGGPEPEAAEGAVADEATGEETADAEEWRNRFLRLSAEFDNFRKRTQRERAAQIQEANGALIKVFLPALDDLARALTVIEKAENAQAVGDGVKLVRKNLMHRLEKQGVKPMNALGQAFDSEYHEAIASLPVEDDAQKGKVIDVVEEGYMYGDKALRYAKVVIGE